MLEDPQKTFQDYSLSMHRAESSSLRCKFDSMANLKVFVSVSPIIKAPTSNEPPKDDSAFDFLIKVDESTFKVISNQLNNYHSIAFRPPRSCCLPNPKSSL